MNALFSRFNPLNVLHPSALRNMGAIVTTLTLAVLLVFSANSVVGQASWGRGTDNNTPGNEGHVGNRAGGAWEKYPPTPVTFIPPLITSTFATAEVNGIIVYNGIGGTGGTGGNGGRGSNAELWQGGGNPGGDGSVGGTGGSGTGNITTANVQGSGVNLGILLSGVGGRGGTGGIGGDAGSNWLHMAGGPGGDGGRGGTGGTGTGNIATANVYSNGFIFNGVGGAIGVAGARNGSGNGTHSGGNRGAGGIGGAGIGNITTANVFAGGTLYNGSGIGGTGHITEVHISGTSNSQRGIVYNGFGMGFDFRDLGISIASSGSASIGRIDRAFVNQFGTLENGVSGGSGWVGTATLNGGTIVNRDRIDNLTYNSGSYSRSGNTGTIGTLNVAGNSSSVSWGGGITTLNNQSSGTVGTFTLASGTTINNGGVINNLTYTGGTYNRTHGSSTGTIGTLNVGVNASTINWGNITTRANVNSGGTVENRSGNTITAATVAGNLLNLSGGIITSATVNSGGILTNNSGGTITGATMTSGARVTNNGTINSLTYSSISTYSGSGTIGILNVAADATRNNNLWGNLATVNVNNGGTFENRSNNIITTASVATGGTLNNAGRINTLTYTGGTYQRHGNSTGDVRIGAGEELESLRIGNGASTSNLVRNIVNNGSVIFNHTGTLTRDETISGWGSVTKEGSGTLVLTGNNTHTGGTTVSAGTFQIGNGGTTGSLTGNIANSGNVRFDRSNTVVYGGVISGTGSLRQAGTGTLILTGDNTFTGVTTIDSGRILQIGNAGTAGDVVGNITNNGNVAFNRSNEIIYGGVISGSGSLTQAGAGTLILTGTNTHNGGTTVNAGTLQIGNGGTIGSLARDITNNANVTFNRSNNLTYSNVISGSGNLTQAGAGILTLTGMNTYTGGTTVNAGTLTGNIANNTNLTVNLGATYNTSGAARSVNVLEGSGSIGNANGLTVQGGTFGGIISGVGDLTKSGTGTLILTGVNTYTGDTLVNAGTLDNRGTINRTTVSGGTFYNLGTINGTATVNSGTFRNGFDGTAGGTGTIGTANVNGGTLTNGHDGLSGTGNITTAHVDGGTLNNWNNSTIGTARVNDGGWLYNSDVAIVNTIFLNGGTVVNKSRIDNLTFTSGTYNWGGLILGGTAEPIDNTIGTLTVAGNSAHVNWGNVTNLNNQVSGIVGTFAMGTGNTVTNAGRINNLTYTGGNYTRSGTGSIDALTVESAANWIDWGNVDTAIVSGNGFLENWNGTHIGTVNVSNDGGVHNFGNASIGAVTIDSGGWLSNFDNASIGSATVNAGNLHNHNTITTATVNGGSLWNRDGGEIGNVTVNDWGFGNHGSIATATINSGNSDNYNTITTATVKGGVLGNWDSGVVGNAMVDGGWLHNHATITTATVNGGDFYNRLNAHTESVTVSNGRLHNWNDATIDTVSVNGGLLYNWDNAFINTAYVSDGGWIGNFNAHYGEATIGNLTMDGGSVNNISRIDNLTYIGGLYDGRQAIDDWGGLRTGTGTIGILTILGDATGIDWGNVGTTSITNGALDNAIGNTIANATVASGGRINNAGAINTATVRNDGVLDNSGGSVGTVTVADTGKVSNNIGSTIGNATVNSGALTNAGSVTGVAFQTGGTITNTGTMNHGMLLNGAFTNAGTVQNAQMFNGTFDNNAHASVDGKSTVSGGVFSNNAGGYVASAEVHGTGEFYNFAGFVDGTLMRARVDDVTVWGGGTFTNLGGEVGNLTTLRSSGAISPASMSLSAIVSASDDNVIRNPGGHLRGITTIDAGTQLYNSNLDLGGFLLPGEIDNLQMLGGTASNGGLIRSMTYFGGTFNDTYDGVGGTIGSLNLSGDARKDVADWGTVNNLAFASDGSGYMSISGFADGSFGGINVMDSVNLANANVQMNLFGSVDDWLGTFSWNNIFFGDTKSDEWNVFGWESALFSFSWDSGDYTDWLSYGETWTSSNGYLVAFGANGMSANAVPEPATLVMIGLGLAGLGYARRRQMMKATAA